MRYLSWLLSCVLHASLLAILIFSVRLHPLFKPELMELDLSQVDTPQEMTELPLPKPPPAPLLQEEPEPETVPEAAAPLLMDKTVVIDDTPQPPPMPEAEPAGEPEAGPDIAPAVEPDAILLKDEDVEEPDLSNVGTALDKANVRKDNLMVSRGHEARFGRALMSDYYSYSSTQFSGQFTTRDDRTISIIDARDTEYGRFLIYDSKNKTLRRMKEAFSKYVYTIGPSLYEDEPVIGTVTFIAKNDRIERFILQTDDDRLAHYPSKIHVRETDTSFPSDGKAIPCTTTLPPEGESHAALVFVHGNLCVYPGLIRGFTRSLSALELASLFFQPRGCQLEEPAPGPQTELVTDTAAALDHLRGLDQTTTTGIWGNGPGAPIALRAAISPGNTSPDFVVCELNDELTSSEMPPAEELKQLEMAVLWIITGRKTTQWNAYVKAIETLRDRNKMPFTIVIAPLKTSKEVEAAASDESALVEQVTSNHAGLAASWVKAINK